MTDHTTRPDGPDSGESVRASPADPAGVAATDAYESEAGVVLFHVENPLAWVEAEDAVALGQMA